MNMKAGILTYHNIPNFGALLQALALCRALRQSGADCEIIDYRCSNVEQRELTFHTSANSVKTIYRRLFYWPGEKEKIRRCTDFMRDQEVVSNRTYTRATIGEANAVYDTFITGSDMVWNLDINGHDLTFFLDFTEDDKTRYSYASSIGGIWAKEEGKHLLPLLKRYESLSAREQDTASWITNELSLDCKWTADPTMLMEASEWERLVFPVREKNYVLVYFPNAGILDAAKTYARRKRKELVVLSFKPFRGRHIKSKAVYTPGEWLSYLHGADAVFTDSYHGILFSIYFKKTFWTNNHSNRMESLFAGLHLEGRFLEENTFENQIDYDACALRMEDMRREALAYIEHMATKNCKIKKTHITANERNCSGCTACKAVCPANAISFEEDIQGFKRPVVSQIKCVECKRCLRVCPVRNPFRESRDIYPNAYAVRWENEEIRENSASGAFFPAMARYILEKKRGYICGCVLNKELMPIHIVTDQWTDVLRMQDSKYVQSDLQDCFAAIKALLSQGNYVLFTGTSCQVAGLKAALHVSGIPEETLLTIDFFCHGVPSPRIWKEYLGFYRRKRRRPVTGYRFRSKKYGWGKTARGANYLNSVRTGRPAMRVIPFRRCRNSRPEDVWDDRSYEARMWRMIFFSDLCLRSYCYTCPYATLHKPADITMGDFWGLDVCLPEFDDAKGTSLVIGRTKKGLAALEQIQYLRKMEVPVELAIKRQANAFAPSMEEKKRAQFWEDYRAHGFDYIAKKYFKYGRAAKVKSTVKLALFKWRLMDYCN